MNFFLRKVHRIFQVIFPLVGWGIHFCLCLFGSRVKRSEGPGTIALGTRTICSIFSGARDQIFNVPGKSLARTRGHMIRWGWDQGPNEKTRQDQGPSQPPEILNYDSLTITLLQQYSSSNFHDDVRVCDVII